MRAFILERLALFVAATAGVALILFLTLEVLPGESGRSLPENRTTAAAAHVDPEVPAPAWQRFLGFMVAPLTGGFGRSMSLDAPVGGLIADRLAVTLPLALSAFLLAAGSGLAAGYWAAGRTGKFQRILSGGTARLLRVLPPFWLGMLLVPALAAGGGWLPTGGFVPWSQSFGAALSSLVLPALALALPHAADLAVATQASIERARQSKHLATAETIGLTTEQAWRRHGMRSAALQLIPTLARLFVSVLIGSVIIENVFYLPGLGRLILSAVAQHDLPLVRGGLLVLLGLAALGVLLFSLGRLWLDPRLRQGSLP